MKISATFAISCFECDGCYYQTISSNGLTHPPAQNGRHFAGDIFRCIFMIEMNSILITISLKLVRKGPINSALV